MDAANFLYKHPRGPIHGYITDGGIRMLRLPRGDASDTRIYLMHTAPNIVLGVRLHEILQQYFAGIRVDFAGIPLDYAGATPFQRVVWEAARQIPWGTTSSYGDVAVAAGRKPNSARAAGGALAVNPVAILIPCHRVLSKTGGLVDYNAGLAWKRELLRLEGALLDE